MNKPITIKGLRCDANLTQAEMAAKLNISTPTYSRYENYDIKIPCTIIVQIMDMFGITNIKDIKYC